MTDIERIANQFQGDAFGLRFRAFALRLLRVVAVPASIVIAGRV